VRTNPTRIAVLGTGSWGTSFTSVLAEAGNTVTMWGRFADEVEDITRNRTSTRYMPDLVLPDSVTATTDATAALTDVEMVVLAVPAQTLRANLLDMAPLLAGKIVVSLIKGIELGTTKRMSEVITECGIQPDLIAILSGPNLAKEIARREPAATTIASRSTATAERVAETCATSYFRPYTNNDVVGTELGGSVKNVIAVAVGMAEGLGLGDNSKAMIITRGLAEMQRLGVALGADPLTLSGLAGVGDLVVTCMSHLSRNNSFGRLLGAGLTMEEAAAEVTQTAEGVKTARPLVELARGHGVEMPIAEAVLGVVEGRWSAADMASALMSRDLTPERL